MIEPITLAFCIEFFFFLKICIELVEEECLAYTVAQRAKETVYRNFS